MAEISKYYDIYIGNRKVGTATGHDSNIDAAGELLQAAEGTIGRSQGVPVAKITLNVITTFGGRAVTQQLVKALLANTPLKLTTGPVDGYIREYKEMWCHSEQLSTEVQSGTAKGVYQFEGAPPKLTG